MFLERLISRLRLGPVPSGHCLMGSAALSPDRARCHGYTFRLSVAKHLAGVCVVKTVSASVGKISNRKNVSEYILINCKAEFRFSRRRGLKRQTPELSPFSAICIINQPDINVKFTKHSLTFHFIRCTNTQIIKSYRQSVSPNCIHLGLKYTHSLFHNHDMFRFQKTIIKWISNINIMNSHIIPYCDGI
jgi:hypothetical protein